MTGLPRMLREKLPDALAVREKGLAGNGAARLIHDVDHPQRERGVHRVGEVNGQRFASADGRGLIAPALRVGRLAVGRADGETLHERVLHPVPVRVFPIAADEEREALAGDERGTDFLQRLDLALDAAGVNEECEPKHIRAPQLLGEFEEGEVHGLVRRVEQADMLVNVSPAHRRGEVDVKLQQVLRQHVGAGINLRDGRGRALPLHRDLQDGSHLASGSGWRARKLAGIEHGPVAQARLQRKRGHEADQPGLDAMLAQHRERLGARLLHEDGQDARPVRRRPLGRLQGGERVPAQAGDFDGEAVGFLGN